jgi:hypothetical protein
MSAKSDISVAGVLRIGRIGRLTAMTIKKQKVRKAHGWLPWLYDVCERAQEHENGKGGPRLSMAHIHCT